MDLESEEPYRVMRMWTGAESLTAMLREARKDLRSSVAKVSSASQGAAQVMAMPEARGWSVDWWTSRGTGMRWRASWAAAMFIGARAERARRSAPIRCECMAITLNELGIHGES